MNPNRRSFVSILLTALGSFFVFALPVKASSSRRLRCKSVAMPIHTKANGTVVRTTITDHYFSDGCIEHTEIEETIALSA